MKENETIEECLKRLQKEYDFSESEIPCDDGVILHGDEPAIVIELNEDWCCRLTNGGTVTYVFWNWNTDKTFYEAEVYGETLSEALNKLEQFCKEQKDKGAVLIDPTCDDFDYY